MTAEAVTPTEYDPAADPGTMPRQRLRVKLRRPGTLRSIAQDDLQPEQILIDRAFTVSERSNSVGAEVAAVGRKLELIADDDLAGVAMALSEMLCAMLEDGAQLLPILAEAWAGDVLTVEYLTRCCQFVQRAQDEVVAAGEG